MTRLDRVRTDPAICHGRPTIRRLRYPVETLLELLASGMTIEETVEEYPDLERDDLLAVLEFGALTSGYRVTPLGRREVPGQRTAARAAHASADGRWTRRRAHRPAVRGEPNVRQEINHLADEQDRVVINSWPERTSSEVSWTTP